MRTTVVLVVIISVIALLIGQYGISVQALSYSLLAIILCCVLFVDLNTSTIHNKFILAGVGLWLVTVWFITAPRDSFGPGSTFSDVLGFGFASVLVDGLIGASVTGGGLLLFSLFTERLTGRVGLGGGDIKLFFMTGLYLGVFGNLLNILLSCILGLIFSFVWNHAKGKYFVLSPRKQSGLTTFRTATFPFGPAIAVSTVVMLFAGPQILSWYF